MSHSSAQIINLMPGLFKFFTAKKTKTTIKLPIVSPLLKLFFSNKKGVTGMYWFFAVVIAATLLVSCQKEALSDPALNSTEKDALLASAGANSSLKVGAGSAQQVVYPSSTSATISGSSSNSNATAVTFLWTQVRGTSTALIDKPTSATTTVSNLQPGLYTFKLTITDQSGIASTDTTNVSVFEKMTWTIEGVTREALVHPPMKGLGPAPVIIVFHGHGGTDLGYSEKAFEASWPEAIVVYAQGLRTKSGVDKEGKKYGWQNSVGEVNSYTGVKDQDLKFFDAMLSKFKQKYNANLSLVFVHGWSNGAEFIYNVLWSVRKDQLAALAPAGARLGTIKGKEPIAVIHTAGTQDDKISFSKQEESVESIRTLNECTSKGTVWATGPSQLLGTRYGSPFHTPVVFLQYEGGHGFPYTVPPIIVKFFKEIAGVPTS